MGVSGRHWNTDSGPPYGSALAAGEATSSEELGVESLVEGEFASLPRRAAKSRVDSFVLGRVAARRALAQLGQHAVEIPRASDGQPLWPLGFVGSIAHTAGQGIALVGRSEEVEVIGIDVETRREVGEIVDLVAFDDELKSVDDEETELLELFAMKEAVFKAFYPKIMRFFGFEAVRIASSPSGQRMCRFVDDLGSAELPTGEFPVFREWLGDTVYAWVVLPVVLD